MKQHINRNFRKQLQPPRNRDLERGYQTREVEMGLALGLYHPPSQELTARPLLVPLEGRTA